MNQEEADQGVAGGQLYGDTQLFIILHINISQAEWTTDAQKSQSHSLALAFS